MAKNISQKRKKKLSNRLFFGIVLIMVFCIFFILWSRSGITSLIPIIQTGWDMMLVVEELDGEYSEILDSPNLLLDKLSTFEERNIYLIELFDDGGVDEGELLYSTWLKTNYPPADGHYNNSDKRNFSFIEPEKSNLLDLEHIMDKYFELRRDIDPKVDDINDEDSGVKYFIYVAKLENGHWIKIYTKYQHLKDTTDVAVISILFMSIFMFSASLVIALVFSRLFARPLTIMASTTQKLSKLDFSQKCPPSRTKEVAILSDSINEMSDALENSLKDLQERNRKLKDDIEKERTLDHLRTSFIANISHELKTPIAIIQGYAEGLKLFIDGDIDMAKDYCDVIMNETKGMHSMVMKLLEIMKYDSGDYKPLNEEFSLFEMAEDWFARNSQILDEKGIKYINEIPHDAVGCGDSILMASVLNNYLSNAIAHCDGEKLIKTSLEKIDGAYRLYVHNTGEAISDRDIDKIWTSFYRADKAMSRSEGRFGLGLAIVDSIQRMHEQKRGVMNTEDGVTFWFDIKSN